MILEEIIAFGHPLVTSRHKTTIEITRENFLTKRGDCIIAVNANKSCFDISTKTKEILRNGEKIKIVFEANNKKDELIAFGDKNLVLENKSCIVLRKSSFIDDRTLVINSNKAACDLNRDLIKELKNPNTKLIIRLVI